VLDPTLLLNQDEWLSISKPINYKKPYIFVYYISYLPQLINFAKKSLTERMKTQNLFYPNSETTTIRALLLSSNESSKQAETI